MIRNQFLADWKLIQNHFYVKRDEFIPKQPSALTLSIHIVIQTTRLNYIPRDYHVLAWACCSYTPGQVFSFLLCISIYLAITLSATLLLFLIWHEAWSVRERVKRRLIMMQKILALYDKRHSIVVWIKTSQFFHS